MTVQEDFRLLASLAVGGYVGRNERVPLVG